MRERQLKAKMADPKAAQRRLYDAIVAKQLDKLEAAARGTSESAQVRKTFEMFWEIFDFFVLDHARFEMTGLCSRFPPKA